MRTTYKTLPIADNSDEIKKLMSQPNIDFEELRLFYYLIETHDTSYDIIIPSDHNNYLSSNGNYEKLLKFIIGYDTGRGAFLNFIQIFHYDYGMPNYLFLSTFQKYFICKIVVEFCHPEFLNTKDHPLNQQSLLKQIEQFFLSGKEVGHLMQAMENDNNSSLSPELLKETDMYFNTMLKEIKEIYRHNVLHTGIIYDQISVDHDHFYYEVRSNIILNKSINKIVSIIQNDLRIIHEASFESYNLNVDNNYNYCYGLFNYLNNILGFTINNQYNEEMQVEGHDDNVFSQEQDSKNDINTSKRKNNEANDNIDLAQDIKQESLVKQQKVTYKDNIGIITEKQKEVSYIISYLLEWISQLPEMIQKQMLTTFRDLINELTFKGQLIHKNKSIDFNTIINYHEQLNDVYNDNNEQNLVHTKFDDNIWGPDKNCKGAIDLSLSATFFTSAFVAALPSLGQNPEQLFY